LPLQVVILMPKETISVGARHHTTFGYKLFVSVSLAPTKPFKTGYDTACYCNYASPIDSGIATGGNLFGVALYFISPLAAGL
jgi:hypothetical protein